MNFLSILYCLNNNLKLKTDEFEEIIKSPILNINSHTINKF